MCCFYNCWCWCCWLWCCCCVVMRSHSTSNHPKLLAEQLHTDLCNYFVYRKSTEKLNGILFRWLCCVCAIRSPAWSCVHQEFPNKMHFFGAKIKSQNVNQQKYSESFAFIFMISLRIELRNKFEKKHHTQRIYDIVFNWIEYRIWKPIFYLCREILEFSLSLSLT